MFFVYFSAAHFNAQIPVLTLFEAISQESTTLSFQDWINSSLLVYIEFLMMKTCLLHIIDNKRATIRYLKFDFMCPLSDMTVYELWSTFNP